MATEITMETDWGAKGAQLTGAQVQAFIKEQLTALHEKDTSESNQQFRASVASCNRWLFCHLSS